MQKISNSSLILCVDCEIAGNKEMAIPSVTQRVSSIRTCTMDPIQSYQRTAATAGRGWGG